MDSDTAYSKDAHALALKNGAEPGNIEQLCSRESLLSILTDANIEADICEDVADTCDLSNLNAFALASGLLSIEQIAQFCFLTKDEAEVCLYCLLGVLLRHCTRSTLEHCDVLFHLIGYTCNTTSFRHMDSHICQLLSSAVSSSPFRGSQSGEAAVAKGSPEGLEHAHAFVFKIGLLCRNPLTICCIARPVHLLHI